MLKLNQFNEFQNMKKRPSYTEKDVADGYIEKNDEDVKRTHQLQTQPFQYSQKIKQTSSLQNNDCLNCLNSEILLDDVNQQSSIEELSSKLNNYIDSYLQELRQPQQFLEQLSLQQSESYEEDQSESLCQKIYSKFISQINLSVIQSYDQISSVDENFKEEKPLSFSTPILSQEVEISIEKNGQKTLFLEQIHLTFSYPLSLSQA